MTKKTHDFDIQYAITPFDPYAHIFQVTLCINTPDPDGQQLHLPSWIPGSYMIRDFARNIVEIQASSNGRAVAIKKLDKQTWQLAPCEAPIELTYQVYAWDMSVRAAHLDQTHAYFNGTSVFLEVIGQAHKPCSVSINNATIKEAQPWRVGTSLPRLSAALYGFGTYHAAHYNDLIDHPVEIGNFDNICFNACGVEHDFIVSGLHNADLKRIADDLTRICEHQIQLFGKPAPFERYVFITWAVGNGYGGLEHQASTSLICNRDDLPCKKERGTVSEGYKTFLGLCSHEYFHSWNVKRIQPNIPYDLRHENHTPLLWAFEGITSYYDDLVLARTGLISPQEYLELLGKTITRILRNPGRFKQSAAESSFDAWTKFYKQDENSGNAIVSYYIKGSLIALGLDLLLRQLSDNKASLDDVMVQLWQRFGQTETPVGEFDIQSIACETLTSTGAKTEAINALNDFLNHAIYGHGDIDIGALLMPFGVSLNVRESISDSDNGGTEKPKAEGRVTLGIATSAEAGGAKVMRVLNQSCSHQSGLSAGDIIIAINNIKVEQNSLEKNLSRFEPGDTITLVAFRRDELMTFNLTLDAPEKDTAYLVIDDPQRLSLWLTSKPS